LTLGGYDTSRFDNKTMSQPFTFSSNDARSLTIGVQSIIATNTLLGTASMTTAGGHLSLIDSTIPHLWLPKAICDNFEKAFGLIYDAQSGLYLLNDTMHATLVANNPSITIQLGNTAFNNGNSTNIVLPYAAFDLEIGWPTYTSTVKYFPIRQAANESQYTLGRTLLQEMYLITDMDRQTFTVAQALFPDANTPSHIVAIQPKNSNSAHKGLGAGAIAGIAIGAVAVLALLAGLFFYFRRRKNLEKARVGELEANQAKINPSYAKVNSGPDGVYETGGTEIQELETPGYLGVPSKERPQNAPHELPSPAPVFEMEGDSTVNSYSQYSPAPPSSRQSRQSPMVSPYETNRFPR
jgi:hypothetical protein